MNIEWLPTWANAIFVIALMLLCALSLSKKINLSVNKIGVNLKVAYYIVATIVVLALAGILFVMAPMQELSATYLGVVGGMTFLAFLACAIGCIDSDDKKHLLISVGFILGVLIVLVTLIFCNIVYAAIWVATFVAFGFIGHLLFSAKK